MCGITGVFDVSGDGPVSLEMLRAMVAMLGHRGPDGYGLFRDERVGLAHARLSIIDLEGGCQPMTNEDRSVWLTCNGEVFNYVELRERLVSQGHRFATASDSEVVVHLYEQHGPDAWAMLNGQFAFALWDRARRLLWLVRDRVGILPLRYATVGRRLLFASEAKALFASGILAPEIAEDALVETFTRWSTAEPRTTFAGVHGVRPGTALCFDEHLRAREWRYWELDFAEDPESARLDLDTAADMLEERLTDAVRLRLRADVPVGAYLSGGLDSSVIGSLIASVDSSPLETFAVRFTDPAFDETTEQRRMAALLGTRHHEIVCDDTTLRDGLESVVWHCEAPLLRTAPVPLFALSRLVHDEHMKVVLTGEGADELLAGYGIFAEDKIRRFWSRQPESRVRPMLFARVHSEVRAARARESELWQQFFARGLTDTDHPWYSHVVRWENTAWAARVLAPEVRAALTPDDLARRLEAELPAHWGSWHPLARAQWLEVTTFMTPYLLAFQGDRVAMAHGVEVRYPFLDPEVVQWCAGLPARLKMPGLRDKVALRRLGSRMLPAEIWRRPKQPYRAPMTSPFLTRGAPGPDLLAEGECRRVGLLDPVAVRRLVTKGTSRGLSGEREEMALVGALSVQMLAHAYGEGFVPRARAQRRRLGDSTPCVVEDLTDPAREEVTQR